MYRFCNVASALAALWLAAAAAMSAAADRHFFMSPDGQLTSKVELRDAQEGFAGVSGTIWVICPDGDFYAARFLNDTEEEPHLKGRLSESDLEELADVLAKEDFRGMPNTMGERVAVNPHRVSVSFRGKTVTLVLKPGASLRELSAAGVPPGSPEGRFFRMANSIHAILEK